MLVTDCLLLFFFFRFFKSVSYFTVNRLVQPFSVTEQLQVQ